MRPSELRRCLPVQDVKRAEHEALRAGASRAAATMAVFAAVYAGLAALHLVAPRLMPGLTDWPAIAHGLLLGLAAYTTLRDAIAVGRGALSDALHSAYVRRSSGRDGPPRD